jgi:Flp pilus assembly protein TadG
MMSIGILAQQRSGATALEFAMIAGLFLPLCLGIFDSGLLLWTKGILQSTASLTARCAAISSPECTDVQQFAVTTAGNWMFPGIITKVDVNPAPGIVCIASVPFMMVTISCQFWAGGLLPPPLDRKTLTSVAYFPVAAAPCS